MFSQLTHVCQQQSEFEHGNRPPGCAELGQLLTRATHLFFAKLPRGDDVRLNQPLTTFGTSGFP